MIVAIHGCDTRVWDALGHAEDFRPMIDLPIVMQEAAIEKHAIGYEEC